MGDKTGEVPPSYAQQPGQPYMQQPGQPYPPQGQPYPGQAPMHGSPPGSYPMQPMGVTTMAPRKMADDQLFMQKLNAIKHYEIRQGNVLAEVLTAGIWANTYMIGDKSRMTTVPGYKDGNKQVATPVFMVKEESGCCGRACCPGNQSFNAKMYHAHPQVQAGRMCCGCCYSGHIYSPDLSQPPIMTMEREGCCSKCLGFFVCNKCCQNDMYIHDGDVNNKPGTTQPDGEWAGRSVMPIGGGGLTPTFELYDGVKRDSPFGYSLGPTCYGGWLGFCCPTNFYLSSQKNKSGDYGVMQKQTPKGCWESCLAICTSLDVYELILTDEAMNLTAAQRAVLLANAVHIDYSFFENDLPPVYFASDDQNNSVVIICTLCQVYCFGCCIPIQICIPLGGGNN